MDAKKKHRYYQNSYYDGNAVRKLNIVPEIERDNERFLREKPHKSPKVAPKRKPAINFFTFLMLTAAIGVTLYSAINYLNIQMGITELNKTVSAKEIELEKLTIENNTKLSKVNASIDLKQIFDVAIGELGMVFPNKNKVITYESAISEYVRQYDSVPEANAEELLDKLFK